MGTQPETQKKLKKMIDKLKIVWYNNIIDKEKSLKPFGIDRGEPITLRSDKTSNPKREVTSRLHKTRSEVKERVIILTMSTI